MRRVLKTQEVVAVHCNCLRVDILVLLNHLVVVHHNRRVVVKNSFLLIHTVQVVLLLRTVDLIVLVWIDHTVFVYC